MQCPPQINTRVAALHNTLVATHIAARTATFPTRSFTRSAQVSIASFWSYCCQRSGPMAVYGIKHAAELLRSLCSLLRPGCFCRVGGRMQPEPVIAFL